ncbi:Hypothetical predicted protein [Octopus vulgaris]|uniref:Uncharacterized protein n=1 Tax=Octopus vulgaris TaxID=6645 RepID=A0AA36ATE8_OCTVU|nr:Hypothetical predicted protein [Octopus vulgaris]
MKLMKIVKEALEWIVTPETNKSSSLVLIELTKENSGSVYRYEIRMQQKYFLILKNTFHTIDHNILLDKFKRNSSYVDTGQMDRQLIPNSRNQSQFKKNQSVTLIRDPTERMTSENQNLSFGMKYQR